jgi:beta-lactamase regulating signal transducer with metallopeptidase domain
MSAWLIDTVLYTGLLIGLVLVLRRPAGKYFGPQLAYALWALPFLRLLLPPIVLPASLAPEAAPLPAMAPVEWTPAPADAVEPSMLDTTPVTVAAAPPPPAWEWSDLIAPAASVWAGVALAFLIWRVVTYQRMRRELLTGARPVGEIGKVRLVETPALAAPVAFGVLDKVIALPPRFMAQPDIAARDLAIAHELAHHQGHDLLANFGAQALLALHWCNPIAWYGWRAMRRDQEAACDARVLAGRSREDVLRYAKLIAGVATGPRLALAAPMACPVLGERSIVHRLRSLSMSETSRRRRWFGRSMIAAGALALPLTASISYSVASAQEPEPVEPTPPVAAVQPVAPVAPPEAIDPDDHFGPHFVVRRVGPDGKHTVREFSWNMPQPPQGRVRGPQPPQFHFDGDWNSEEFQQRMEQVQDQMEQFREKWGEQYGEQWEQWAENYAEQWEQWGEQHAAQAEALAERHREHGERQRELALERAEQARERGEQQREQALERAEQTRELAEQARAAALASVQVAVAAPVVVRTCDESDRGRGATTSDGRTRIDLCGIKVRSMVMARSSLRDARNAIANNQDISDSVRRDVLDDLDEEIERLEHDSDD